MVTARAPDDTDPDLLGSLQQLYESLVDYENNLGSESNSRNWLVKAKRLVQKLIQTIPHSNGFNVRPSLHRLADLLDQL